VTQATPPSIPAPYPAPAEGSGGDGLLDESRTPLRLTVTRGVLGLELYEPIEVGPLTVEALSLTLPNLKFPVDLSGGVRRFRHRRGQLERMRLGLSFERFSRFVSSRAREVIGAPGRCTLWAREAGFGIGLLGTDCALSFDLLWAPTEGDARWVVSRARGVGLKGPALGYALRVLDAVVGKLGQRQGRVLTLPRAGFALGQLLLPAVGARAPSAGRVHFGELELDAEGVRLELDSTFLPTLLTAEVTRELELGLSVSEADAALSAGELDRARERYVEALERAPRHPELVRLIAEIDSAVGGRGEAALGLLVESLPAQRAGLVGAELLARVGDLVSAREALREALRDEPFAPLASLSLCRLAELETHPADRRAALDQAVARAPSLVLPRWARFLARLELGDTRGALSDAEHLEATNSGARARHDACRRAARALLEHGYVSDAGRMFERALRYVPDDAAATAGLARSLIESGRKQRAVTLLERAIELSEKRGGPDSDALLDLAKLLADEFSDLPQAVARVRAVDASSEHLVEARRLEGLWRSRLGDVPGASLAYGRMREAIELGAKTKPEVVTWLTEAAQFEREARLEPAAAERHLGVALRLAPHDPLLGARYREAAAELVERLRRDREAARGR
jgi:tetratricopeptide (TPR) repeat protein